jgi:hypothetical protein
MPRSPKELIANSSVTWEEAAQLGMRSAQIGCPDIRQEITKILWPPKVEDERIVRGMGPTLGQLLKAPKVTQAALAGFLAIVKSNYETLGHVPSEYQGACNVPIPVEVIALIGEVLVSKTLWSKTYNDAQREQARKQDAKWQAKADAVWLKHPKLSPKAVAQRIAPDNFNYVRQRISKPAK